MNPEKEKEKALWRQQKHLEIKEELRQNEKLKKLLEPAYPDSRDKFIDDYAAKKVRWLEYGPNHKEWLEREDLKWVNDATGRLEEIQQKKLFDVQCLWRAEKIEIPELKLTEDFKYWEENVFNCPFTEPVTEQEVEYYIQYLQSLNFENEQGWFDRWQDYKEIKKAYNSEDANRNFPDWYDFHNGRTGLSAYLLLPDVRGEKEDFYIRLWNKEFHENIAREKKKKEEEANLNKSEPAPQEVQDKRPGLSYHGKGWLTWFVTTYEDKETQEMFKKYGGERDSDSNDDEYLTNDLKLLSRADKPVPIEGWFDWKEAIHKAADRYRIEKIIDALPVAYEQYRMNVDLNIPFAEPESLKKIDYKNGYGKAVLRGRELNGEPGDFDF